MDMLQNNRVLITGGAGFIGSNLANALSDDNAVIVVDDGYLGIRENLSETVEFYERSVLEDDLPTDVDVIFHLAALSSYAMHEANPCRGARVNVEGFVNVVEQARNSGCSTVVYASTSSLYGSRATPISERADVTVNTAYEASKLSREQYAEYFANHYEMNVAGVRLFSVYQGYGGNEEHKGQYANVVAQFADDIVHGRSPTLYGTGEQTRDFTHVDDVVSALVAVAHHRLTGIYNVGTGQAVSFNQLVDLLNQELGTAVDPEYIPNPIPERVYVHDTVANPSKLQAATGWKPTISLKEGLERVCSQYTVHQTDTQNSTTE